MRESAELSELIGEIYDAALDSTRWTGALEKTGAFLRSAATTVGAFDSVQSSANFQFTWGYDPEYLALYVERYAKLNPLITASGQTKVGDVVSTGAFMSFEELQATRFYQEWVRPQGYVDAAQATLEKSGSLLIVLAALRHESAGRCDDTMLRRMALVLPHFRRAVLISKVIDLKTIEAAAFAETIDRLSAGIFLVNARGAVVHANASGEALLEDGVVVSVRAGILSTSEANSDRSLKEGIVAAGESDVDAAGKGIGIPLFGANGQSHILHVLPLSSGSRATAGRSHAAIAAVFVHKASIDLAAPVDSVARHYGLTPTETTVLRAVVEHGGVTPIAAKLGISEATVKTHLQHLFEKTGSSRQVDLVKLTFAFADPLSS